jgi:diacylglycerol kinase
MRVHSFAAILVLVANIMLNVSRTDWVLTIIIISITFSAEVLNTAIEKLADRVSLEQDPLIGKAKDLAAGAVLIISVGAAICGAIIYLPYLFSL